MRRALVAVALVACHPRAATPGEDTAREPAAQPLIPGHMVSQATLDRVLAEGTPVQWLGLYIGGKKVGYFRGETRRSRPGEQDAIVASLSGRFRGGMAGATIDVDLELDTFYARTRPYLLIASRERMHSESGTVELSFELDGDELVVRQIVDGRAQPERRVPASRESLIDALPVEPADLSVGMRVATPSFDSEKERDVLDIDTVIEKRRQRVSGIDTDVLVLRSQEEGDPVVSTSVYASGGLLLSGQLGGFDVRWEEEERAQSDVVGYDALADGVPIDRPLGGSDVRELHLVVRGPPELQLPSAANQEVARRADGALDVALYARPGPQVSAEERRAALESTPFIDAADPAIANLAREVVAGDPDRARQVERLVAWTYANLEKSVYNATTASQVLARRKGDCTEHALLFVALARAVGIPAREVGGFVYIDDSAQRFGAHEWAEVELDGRWVQVDPTLGEPLANATHLTLNVGENDDAFIVALAGLRLELVGAPVH